MWNRWTTKRALSRSSAVQPSLPQRSCASRPHSAGVPGANGRNVVPARIRLFSHIPPLSPRAFQTLLFLALGWSCLLQFLAQRCRELQKVGSPTAVVSDSEVGSPTEIYGSTDVGSPTAIASLDDVCSSPAETEIASSSVCSPTEIASSVDPTDVANSADVDTPLEDVVSWSSV